MAVLIPSDNEAQAAAHAHLGEIETLQHLKTDLTDDYTVFHNVHWSRSSPKATAYGEIDFVVVNRSGDILLIEQKNGALIETEGDLLKRYGDTTKHVGDQIRRSLENVREKYRKQSSGKLRLTIDYLIFCPDYRLKAVTGVGVDRNRIVDAREKHLLGQRIRRILGPGSADDDDQLEKVRTFFRNTFEVVPDIHARATAQEREYLRLSGALIEFVAGLEMTPLRLRIRGTAGCGKSLLAAHYYETALADGKRPLVVCFNRLLKERLAARLGRGGKVATFHGLCDEFLRSQGRTVDFDRRNDDADFWRRLADSVIDLEVPEDWQFDRLVVDEGQDFEADWLDILRLFVRPGHDLVWLEDPDQNLYGKAPVPLDKVTTYNAKQNFRSPRRIAEFIQGALPFEFECRNPLAGLGVGVSDYDDPSEQPLIVADLVDKLVKQGFDHSDIVLLTCRGYNSSSPFSSQTTLGRFTLRRFTGDYDADGNQILTDGDLHFDSVYRFKGQQAQAVILTDIDPDQGRWESHFQNVLYCGMTRATMRLELVRNGSNPVVDAFEPA